MALSSHNTAPSLKARFQTPHLVIIEFILDELLDVRSTGQMLYMSLTPNYLKNKEDIHLEKIQFNLKNEDAVLDHIQHVSDRVKELKTMYVISLLFFQLTNLSDIFP